MIYITRVYRNGSLMGTSFFCSRQCQFLDVIDNQMVIDYFGTKDRYTFIRFSIPNRPCTRPCDRCSGKMGDADAD